MGERVEARTAVRERIRRARSRWRRGQFWSYQSVLCILGWGSVGRGSLIMLGGGV
jgi:hypothetical protein